MTSRHLQSSHRRVLVFVKAPEPGKVKTRLIGPLDAAVAAELYKCFAADILATLTNRGYPVTIFHHPPSGAACVADWLGRDRAYRPQQGSDLGERMADAFSRTFAEGYGIAVLIGSDFPDLPGALIDDAFNALNRSAAVIGPAVDGGYYLIGFRSDGFVRDVFRDMPWGEKTVYADTVDRFSALKCNVHILPEWRDIDEWEDLADFMESRNPASRAAMNTVNYLKSLGLM